MDQQYTNIGSTVAPAGVYASQAHNKLQGYQALAQCCFGIGPALQRRPNLKTKSGQCSVFAGLTHNLLVTHIYHILNNISSKEMTLCTFIIRTFELQFETFNFLYNCLL